MILAGYRSISGRVDNRPLGGDKASDFRQGGEAFASHLVFSRLVLVCSRGNDRSSLETPFVHRAVIHPPSPTRNLRYLASIIPLILLNSSFPLKKCRRIVLSYHLCTERIVKIRLDKKNIVSRRRCLCILLLFCKIFYMKYREYGVGNRLWRNFVI